MVPLPSDTTAIWLPNPTDISMKDAYRPCDMINTEFENVPHDITMKFADIDFGEPDELDPEIVLQYILIEGPLLP